MNKRRAMLGGLGAALLSPTLGAHPLDAKPATPSPDLEAGLPAASSDATGYFPNSVFTTHEGKQVRFYDDLIKDRIVIITMVLIGCKDGICPVMTANLRAVQAALGDRVGKDISMVSMTIQPEYDTHFMLNAYAKNFKTAAGWSFVTGQKKDTEIIRRKLGFSSLDPETDKDPNQHTGMVRIGNDKLNRWCMMPGMLSAKQIAYAVRDLA